MTKTVKIFDVLRFLREDKYLHPQDLAELCEVDKRTVYRYMNTLNRAGVHVRFMDNGYKLQGTVPDSLDGISPEDMRALRIFLARGMVGYTDSQAVERGRRLLQMIDNAFPDCVDPGGRIRVLPKHARPSAYGGQIVVGHATKPEAINPFKTHETISVNIMTLIYNYLVRWDGHGNFVPDVATKWNVSDDGLIWTFHLREGVYFHNGKKLTAHDVADSYNRPMQSDSPFSERCSIIDEVSPDSEYVFRLKLKHPYAPCLDRLNFPILAQGTEAVGSGPFRLAEWGDTIVLQANERYYEEARPILNRIIFKQYDSEAALEAISKGDIDIALDLTCADISFANRFRVYAVPDGSYYALFLNMQKPVFQDIRVRLAMDCAIDKEAIVDRQLKHYGKVCTGPFDRNSWAYDPDIPVSVHSIQRAKELLSAADAKASISIAIQNRADGLERIAWAIRAQLIKAGIKTRLVYDSTESDCVLARVCAGADPDCAYRFWHTTGVDNLAGYSNRRVDRLLEDGRQMIDVGKRQSVYREIHKIVNAETPAVFIATGCDFIGSKHRFLCDIPPTLLFLSSLKDCELLQVGGSQVTSMNQSVL